MKTSKILLATQKETPNNSELISHKYMIKAGLIRQLSSGIYQWLPTGNKILQNIKDIIRKEMNKIGAMEILMPNIIPYDILKETGRWEKFGKELLKIKYRNTRQFCYAPTHEESIVHLIRKEIHSYKQLPLTFYQIQNKFRDEIRPRFGIMRAREFIMKDAYSFHDNYNSLEEHYNIIKNTYSIILKKLGINFSIVLADSGNMGGIKSHEFQALASSGEDILYYDDKNNYTANVEIAEYLKPNLHNLPEPKEHLSKKNIEINNINLNDIKKLVKTIVIQDSSKKIYSLILRISDELNETKLTNLKEINPPFYYLKEKVIKLKYGIDLNSMGPVNSPIPMIVDYRAAFLNDFISGANEHNTYFYGVNWNRDIYKSSYIIRDIRKVMIGDYSIYGNKLKQTNGIEVAHIFKLGERYTNVMNAKILDKHSKRKNLIMGCYGFGISRVIAAIIEQSHDKHGIIWPNNIAPYKIIIIPINFYKNKKVLECSNKIFNNLINAGFEDILLEDRKESIGVMFADADLIGISHQIIISENGINNNYLEYKNRKTQLKEKIRLNNLEYLINKLSNN